MTPTAPRVLQPVITARGGATSTHSPPIRSCTTTQPAGHETPAAGSPRSLPITAPDAEAGTAKTAAAHVMTNSARGAVLRGPAGAPHFPEWKRIVRSRYIRPPELASAAG